MMSSLARREAKRMQDTGSRRRDEPQSKLVSGDKREKRANFNKTK